MTKREPLMDAAYFGQTIAHIQKTAVRFEGIVENPDAKPEQKKRLLYSLFRDSYELLIARYSAGEPIADLRPAFTTVVQRRERHQQELGRLGNDFAAADDYVTSLWLVSLSISLDVDPTLFERLLKCIGNEGRDKLFERIVSTRVPGRPIGESVIFPKPYQSLLDAIGAADGERPKLIASFLKTWYPSLGKLKVYWYDCHKGPEGGGFFGYWCLEAAAVVKAFGIDDQTFRDAPYYPKDLSRGV